MKNISKIGMMIVAGGMLAATSCSDFSDYNTAPEAYTPSAELTLWENISGNENLSDFAAVLKRVGYDKVLSASRTYTVWAPVNGSFNMDSLSQVSDDKVEREFVRNLIADYAHKENDVNDTTIYMLNEKLLRFSNKNSAALAFDAGKILPNASNPAVFNYPSVNGLLYTIAAPAVFRFNGYEYITEAAEKFSATKMNTYFQKYERIELDEAASVKGEIIDGVQHYDDSVVIVKNYMIEDRQYLNAAINNEDSSYTVLIPTDEAWDNAYSKISAYYNYIPEIAWQDLTSSAVGNTKGGTTPTKPSGRATIMKADLGKMTAKIAPAPADAELQETGAYWNDSITKGWITKASFFSETMKRYNSKLTSGEPFADNDTLYATSRMFLTNPASLEAVTEDIVKLSNGHARIVNAFPFSPEDTYAPIIETREVARVVSQTGYSYEYVTYDKALLDPSVCVVDDDETALRYVRTPLPENAAQATELDFYLEGVLSTTYDIYAVIVPGCVEKPELTEEERLPYTLRFDINYTDANNKQIAGRFDGEGVKTTIQDMSRVPAFLVAQNKVDTVKLGRVTFPICYAYTDAKPNIKVMHTLSAFSKTSRAQYEQILRVANIILKPVATEENEENAIKED